MVILYALCAAAILLGIRWMSSPETAVRGNLTGASAVLVAVVAVLIAEGLLSAVHLWMALLIGSAIGLFFGRTMPIIAMPQFVAMLNGLGGAASAFIALVVLFGREGGAVSNWALWAASLALLVGGLTLSGSLVAAGKLSARLTQRPVVLPFHQVWVTLTALLGVALLVITSLQTSTLAVLALVAVALLFGVLFTVPIGGADMPVTISLLNSFSGLAGAIAGFSVNNLLVVAAGGIVGAAGLILTQIMCRGMNRNLAQILTGKTTSAASPDSGQRSRSGQSASLASAVSVLNEARSVIIVPGYGMAVSQAQEQVKELIDLLASEGCDVRVAIHPVAGRMPGHMNVLLAEVDVPYDRLFALEQINDAFADTDVVVIVGANDVVNPAALRAKGTAIYGMPILNAHEAQHVIVCNFDTNPGYAGVDNTLYEEPNCSLLLGDAKKTLNAMLRQLREHSGDESLDPRILAEVASKLAHAKNVVIVPGYGMAVAQAQQEVKRLMELLEDLGCRVRIAIHPVAGRMPGHMNVLLAEVDVPYSKLFALEQINDAFSEVDVSIIVGANDVVNPAALDAKGTAIYGMPILNVHQSRSVVICNFDTNPGYSGVPNPLYDDDKALLLLGDARSTLKQLNEYVSELETSQAPAE